MKSHILIINTNGVNDFAQVKTVQHREDEDPVEAEAMEGYPSDYHFQLTKKHLQQLKKDIDLILKNI